MKLEIAVESSIVQDVIDAIREKANTEQIGDGKIFVLPMEKAIRIRTGEENEDAL